MSTTRYAAGENVTEPSSPSQVFDVTLADAECDGCAEHSDPECLCDVIVTDPVEIINPNPELLYVVDDPAKFVDWAANIASMQTLVATIDVDLAMEAAEDAYVALDTKDFVAAMRKCIKAGLNLASAAELFGYTPLALVRRWHNNPNIQSAEPYVEAERLLNGTCMTYAKVSKATGLSVNSVRTLSELYETSPRRRRLDMLQAEARAYARTGMGGTAIARRMTADHGELISKDRVYGWLRPDRQRAA